MNSNGGHEEPCLLMSQDKLYGDIHPVKKLPYTSHNLCVCTKKMRSR